MKGSRWVLVLVILAIVGVLIAKETTRTRPTRQPEQRAQVPENQNVPNPVASPETPSRAENPGAGAASSPPESRSAVPSKESPSAARETGRSSGSLTSQPAEARPAPEEKPEGPLPGSKLADCLKSGRPTMADFGKGWCIPCKQMVPVLKQAAQDYWGKANIVFVDMEEYMDLAGQYRIALMPTQIFFDAKGEEVTRHMGYMDGPEIDRQLRALGVKR